MTVNEYQRQAMATLNPALDKKDVLINSVMGLCGEAGEAIDIVKKWLAQGHELDKERLARELGDVAWYLAEAAAALDMPLEQILQGNLDKLKARYPEGFLPKDHGNGSKRICKATAQGAEFREAERATHPCRYMVQRGILWSFGICTPLTAEKRERP